MTRPRNLWTALETAGDSRLSRDRWTSLLGQDAALLNSYFVVDDKSPPPTTPCRKCPRTLRLSKGPKGVIVGMPDTPCAKCDSYQLFEPEDVAHWHVVPRALLTNIADALRFDLATVPPDLSALPFSFASLLRDGARHPVFLSIRPDARQYAIDAERLVRLRKRDFVLLTASYSEEAELIVNTQSASCFAAMDHLTHDADGNLVASPAVLSLLHPPVLPVPAAKGRKALRTAAHGVVIEDDYRFIRYPDGRVIDFTEHPVPQAFVKYCHQRKLASGEYVFLFHTAAADFNKANPQQAINSDRLKHDLFKFDKPACDLLFEKVSGKAQKFRFLL